MILRAQFVDGTSRSVTVDDGIGLQVLPWVEFVTPIPVANLSAVALEQDAVNPVVRVTYSGRYQVPYAASPASLIVAGGETFTVSELQNLSLEPDRVAA